MARAIVSATITFGLVAIPVKFYTAASDEGVKFNMITSAGNRVKQRMFDGVTEKEVTHDQCTKGYEHSKNQFVVFTKDELAAIELKTTKTIDITEFVDAAAIDLVHIDKTYYLGPDKGGDKGYALLSDAMTAQGKVAVAQWNNKGKGNLVVVRPYKKGLILQILFYANEIRDFSELEVAVLPISDAERKLANQLLNALTSDEFEPEKYEDEYAKAVIEAVEAKVAGKEITIPADAPPTASALDLFEALKNSLAKPKPKKASVAKPAAKAKKK